MTQFYYSVDVETTSTNPFNGQILTFGMCAINAETLEMSEGLHIPIQYATGGPVDPATYDWWLEQESSTYETAWGQGQKRFTAKEACQKITDFILERSSLQESIFAANPVSFDFAWTRKLFTEGDHTLPFNYRTLCMRSMSFGITGGRWGQARALDNPHVSKIPHHALYDAEAQGLDLIDMIDLIEYRKQEQLERRSRD